jgi:signal peptidase I
MTFDFALYLTVAVVLCGAIYCTDRWFFAPRRQRVGQMTLPIWIDYPRSLFVPLLVVWLLRSFVGQLFLVPTPSLEPTVIPVELLAVEQFAYGLRLPVFHYKLWSVGEPQVGDIAVFRWPVDPSQHFVKRVIGTPGDKIEYRDKVLYVNGEAAVQTDLGTVEDSQATPSLPVNLRRETINGVTHQIFLRKTTQETGDFELVVPPGHYFMMGDNRDNSNDSRVWGFVPEENLVGKARWIVLSWDRTAHRVRWQRMGARV